MVIESIKQDVFLPWTPELGRRVAEDLHRDLDAAGDGQRIERLASRASLVERRLIEALQELVSGPPDFDAAWDRAVSAMADLREAVELVP